MSCLLKADLYSVSFWNVQDYTQRGTDSKKRMTN